MHDGEESTAQLKAWILWACLTLAVALSGVLARLWLADLDGKLKTHLDEISILRESVVAHNKALAVLETEQRRSKEDRADMENRLRAVCRVVPKSC